MLARGAVAARRAGSAEAERAALAAALGRAGEGIRALRAAEGGEAADILEFQELLVEDDELTGAGLRGDRGGSGGGCGLGGGADARDRRLCRRGDAYMAARAEDLADLRDRVLAALDGAEAAARRRPRARS